VTSVAAPRNGARGIEFEDPVSSDGTVACERLQGKRLKGAALICPDLVPQILANNSDKRARSSYLSYPGCLTSKPLRASMKFFYMCSQ
jgi:hypothetical protein